MDKNTTANHNRHRQPIRNQWTCDKCAAEVNGPAVPTEPTLDARTQRRLDEDAEDDYAENEYDLWAAHFSWMTEENDTDEFLAYARDEVRAAYAAREYLSAERGAYYDVTQARITTPFPPALVRSILAAGDGQSMASYGSFGGYSTIGRVWTEPHFPGDVIVESVYHIGD